MPDGIKPWGTCYECGKDINLKKDGTLRHHTNQYPLSNGNWYRHTCTGVGRKPGWVPSKFRTEAAC
jgi:hypothetical protein